MDFSKRFSELVNNKGVTIYEIATKTGISESTLGKLLRGITKKPNLNNSEILAKYFNISTDWLRTGMGNRGSYNAKTIEKIRDRTQIEEETNVEMFLQEIAAQRKLTERAQEQMSEAQKQMGILLDVLKDKI